MRNIFLKTVILFAALCLPVLLQAQQKPNWQNLDLKTDSVFGISTEKAYAELLPGKKHVTVVVAVIDGGVDTAHEDLQGVIWTNPKEIPGNHKDDDKNGYVDDVHGWDFIGGANGDEQYDNLVIVRILRKEKPLYENADTTKLSAAELVNYHKYRVMQADLAKQVKDAQAKLQRALRSKAIVDSILVAINKPDPSFDDIKSYKAKNDNEKYALGTLLFNLSGGGNYANYKARTENRIKDDSITLYYQLNLNYDPRGIVGDDYGNVKQRNYGNTDVTGPDADHGTHVSGIIGALRDNNLGIKGIANDVKIMPVRAVPNGDERDKDIANGIRYAVDNGARIINMSFGKDYPDNKKVVDEAVKYAMRKDVLIVMAAGNSNDNVDSVASYPNRVYANGKQAKAWIEVGASNSKDNESLKANFSSYGKTGVDVFAPGVRIKSSVQGSKYDFYSGTSMACPMVVGLAALIRSYYPKLTAVQVKDIIIKSVAKVNHNVLLNGKEVPFTDLCLSGGIVNAYNALQLAATY